ncbi:2-oxo-hept-3-ene-1,7-dioate hydratase [Microbacterium sp. SLBN-111]
MSHFVQQTSPETAQSGTRPTGTGNAPDATLRKEPMLTDEQIDDIAAELAEADRTHAVIPRITARYPDATVEDSYAIQGRWRDTQVAAGRTLVGRKIGLTSRAMQQATGITEPDYGVMFDDTVYRSGDEIPVDHFSNVRVEVELAFVLKAPLEGPDCTLDDALAAIDYAVPALEVLNSHIELEGRTIVDTISDNAAYGAMVLGDVHKRPDEIDLRWVPGVLSRNGEVEETGVAAGVLGHPATGVAWLANKFAQHGARLEAGEIILAGSFTRPMWVSRGDDVSCDFGPMGTLTCRFV